jgi:hypothetical protein
VLPSLPVEAWEPTRITLHLWSQIVGKVALATTAPLNHWWNVTFTVDVRGLRTRRLHHDGVAFDLSFDFVDHALIARTDRGESKAIMLEDGLSVAEVDARLHRALRDLGVDVAIREEPFGVPMTTPFGEDLEHAAYDREYVDRFRRALSWIDGVLWEFAGWSSAKTSPVQLFWHSFDLAVTRFSGRRAPQTPGADGVTREAYSHEVISFGFWAGDANVREPMFYSYTAPEPAGLGDEPLTPGAASWAQGPTGAMAMLRYAAVRDAEDPRATLLAFLQSAYEAGARTAGWDTDELVSAFSPGAGALEDLRRR